MQNNKHQLYIPLYIVIGFNLFTFLAFVTAPFDWSKGSPMLVAAYLLINYIFIILGYRYGIKRAEKRTLQNALVLSDNSKFVITGVFVFYSLTFLIKYAYLLRFPVFDVSGMFSYLTIGFFDPQLGYHLSVYDTRPHTVSWLVFTIISIVNQVFFVFGFISWKRLKFSTKLLFSFFVLIEVYYWMGRGTGFGIITLLTTLVACIMAQLKLSRINLATAFMFFLLFLVGIGTFGYLKNQRAGGEEIAISNFNQNSAPVDVNHAVLKVVPKSMTQTYMHSVSYLTQGYYHLGLAMNYCSFSSTYFFGNNPASLNVATTFGNDLWKDTYMYKLYASQGIDDYGKWHSAYLWYANDVSFFGVPLVLFIISSFTSFAYSMVVRYNDLLSKVIFVILINMLLFLFANNSYLSFHFYSLTVLFIIWYFSRVKSLR